jgi:hypothetical protein
MKDEHGAILKIVARLVARKQRLLGRLKEGLGPHEREEIERQLEEIDATFDFLDEAEAGEPARRRTIYSQGCLDPRLEMLAQWYRLEAELCLEMVSRAEDAVRRQWLLAATRWIEAGRRPKTGGTVEKFATGRRAWPRMRCSAASRQCAEIRAE